MTNSLARAVFGFGFILVGIGMVVFAAEEQREAADLSVDALEALDPVMITVIEVLPILLLLVAGLGMIGATAWLTSRTSNGGLR